MHGNSVDLKALINGQQTVNGVLHSEELLRFVDAVLNVQSAAEPANTVTAESHTEALDQARATLRQVLTDAAFVDVCATVASFNAVVKVADGTGIPLEDQKAEKTAQLRAELQIDQLRDHGHFDKSS